MTANASGNATINATLAAGSVGRTITTTATNASFTMSAGAGASPLRTGQARQRAVVFDYAA